MATLLGNGPNLYTGSVGGDNVNGGNANDTLNGGTGNDTLNGGNGNDWLSGGADNDVLLGGNGNDWLYGDSGNDSLDGGNGDDHLYGGVGENILNGGRGDDFYVIDTAFGHSNIVDESGNDTLDFSSMQQNLEIHLDQGFASIAMDTDQTRVNTFAPGNQVNADVTVLSDGGYVVIWRDDGRNGLYAQRYDSHSIPVGGEFKVNTSPITAAFPAITVPSISATDDGGFVAVWQSKVNGYVYGQRYDVTGHTAGGEFTIDNTPLVTAQQPLVDVQGLTGGKFIVTWEDSDGNQEGVFGKIYNGDGSSSAQFQINQTTVSLQKMPNIGVLHDGSLIVTWSSAGIDGSGLAVMARHFDNLGHALGNEFQVSTYAAGHQMIPTVAGLADGGYVIAWQSALQDGSGWGIYGQMYNADGSHHGSEFRMNTTTLGDQQYVRSICTLGNGDFIAVWQSDHQDGSGNGVFGQRFDHDGHMLGSEFQINTTTQWDQSVSTIVGLHDGGFIVTWQTSNNAAGTDFDINVQRFDANGNPVGVVLTELAHFTPGAIENAIGGYGDDLLVGNCQDNHLYGQDGDDTYGGFTGNFGHDIITDLSGTHDVADFSHFNTGDAKWLALDTNGNGNVDQLYLKFTNGSTLAVDNYFADNSHTAGTSLAGSGHIETFFFANDHSVNLADVQALIH